MGMETYYGIQNIRLVSRHCYFVGLGIGVAGLLGVIVMSMLHIHILHFIPPCTFYTATGYYCPGCGGTRAVTAMLRGNIFSSLYYHPFVLYISVYYIVFELSHTLDIMTKGKIRGLRFCPLYFYIGIGIIIVQWVAKNYVRFKYGMEL